MKLTWLIIPYALLVIATLSGCAAVKRPMVPMVRIEGNNRPFFAGQIVAPKDNLVVDYQKLIQQLSKADVVFIGEIHDNADHHLIQVQILQSLRKTWGNFALAVECIPYEMQPLVDMYLTGRLSEKEFLTKIKWDQTWGFDYHFYRPLFQLAAKCGDHILAINAPQELVKKVARNGLASLTPAERSRLPREIDLTDKAQRAYIGQIYREHTSGDLKDFDYFYQAQCIWEETMAQKIADYLKAKHDRVVVICGNGHINFDFGIPKRLRRRIPVRTATLVPYPVTTKTVIKKDIANFVWFTGHYFPLNHMRPHRKATRNQKEK